MALHLEELAGVTVKQAGMGPCPPDHFNPWERPEAILTKPQAESERGT